MNGDLTVAAAPSVTFSRAIPSLVLLASVFLLNFFARIIFSPLLPEIEREMELSHAVAGSLFFFISSGYFLSILFSTAVSSRLGHKRTIVLSTLLSGLTLCLLAFCTTITTMRLGLFCLGYGAGLYLRSGLSTISRLVAPAYLARGLAIHEVAPNLAFVAAPLLCALMLDHVSWRQGLQLLGLMLATMGVVYALVGGGDSRKDRRLDLSQLHNLLTNPQFWLMVLLFSLAICSTLGVYAMLPLYLVAEQGMDQEAANRMVSLSRISSVFMPLAAGWLGDRFGNRLVMVGALSAAGLLTIPLGLTSGPLLVLFVVLQPIVAVSFFPSAFAVLSRVGGPEAQGATVTLCIPLAFLVGGGVLPTVIGLAGDWYSLAGGLVGIGGAITLVALLAFWLERRGWLSIGG